jgi:hypothetical protein
MREFVCGTLDNDNVACGSVSKGKGRMRAEKLGPTGEMFESKLTQTMY